MLKFNFYFITTDYCTIFGKNFKLKIIMEKEFKGTKGEYCNERNEIHYNDDGECIAEHVANDYDALLISKAPEMLQMLIELRQIFDKYSVDFESQFFKYKEPIEKLIKETTQI